MNIIDKYILIEKINEGSFGTIFKCKNMRTDEYNALKLEKRNAEGKSLKNEARIYQYLGKIDGFPTLKWYGVTSKYNYMVIDLLDCSLINLVKIYGALSIKSVLLIGMQMIKRIKELHVRELLHRDIKPDNFMIGLENQSNKIFLIDFSFCKRYIQNNKHIEEKRINNIIGTANYVSLNVHDGIEPSRRDDIESLIYILIFLLLGKISWNKSSIGDIYEQKKNLPLQSNIPSFIKILLTYVRSLNFKDPPDYDYLLGILNKEFYQLKLTNSIDFEWSK
jgi:serine/threonine protein kinase